jgi:hypothetical protein
MTTIATWDEAREAYRDMLDEIYGELEVAGLTYQTSRVLEEIDPIAFRCGLLDWLDAEGIDSDDLTD